jgi:hypothetical protein
MFERYTEHARRVIFFARYEASAAGSPYLEPEHLLLGLLREDPTLRGRLLSEARDQIRKRIEENSPRREKISTSVDLPLSTDSKRVLALGAKESDALNHKVIDCGHLVLGLLRLEKGIAATLLPQYGVDYESYRGVVSEPTVAPPKSEQRLRPVRIRTYDREIEWDEPEPQTAAAPSLQGPIDALAGFVAATVEHIDAFSDAYGRRRLKRKPWSRKEAVGHLIDWAIAHRRWFVRALTEPKVVARGYPPDDWVSAQQYGAFPWPELVAVWLGENRLLIHVLRQIPEGKINTPCRIGIDKPIPLAQVIARYVAQCEDVLGQILARL